MGSVCLHIQVAVPCHIVDRGALSCFNVVCHVTCALHDFTMIVHKKLSCICFELLLCIRRCNFDFIHLKKKKLIRRS